MYAVIATGGKQYKVSEGDVIYVEKLDAEKDSEITFDQVLAVGGEKMTIGSPIVDSATVTGKVLDQVKGKKIIVYHYKRKSGYHKKNGHRQAYTKVQIDKINA